ncbi:ribonuclease 1 [Brachypodium distachyon]|nr:ribonuclease 1 [Brachypodium distachyon]|eukprot:XP_003574555.3 ribonuclease 1 [Brachypodium distachyon]
MIRDPHLPKKNAYKFTAPIACNPHHHRRLPPISSPRINTSNRESTEIAPGAMRAHLSLAVLLVLTIGCAAPALAAAQDYDFFFLVLQWPGSYCDTKKSCCYPKSGKPAADFGIHGLWPNRDDGTYPQDCNPDNAFDPSKVSDLLGSMRKNWPTLACPTNDGVRFWGHEWEKHGTCAENLFDEHGYFSTALRLRDQLRVLDALRSGGISPDGGYYTLSAIKGAIQQGTGFEPFVECNRDESGNSQLYQLYFCVDAGATKFVECPVSPGGRPCGNRIEFPAF